MFIKGYGYIVRLSHFEEALYVYQRLWLHCKVITCSGGTLCLLKVKAAL